MRNVVMLAAGAGEELFYCGGTLRLHAEAGDNVRSAAPIRRGEALSAEAREAYDVIGVPPPEEKTAGEGLAGWRAVLEEILTSGDAPDVIYVPDEKLRPGLAEAVRDSAPKNAEILLYGECSRQPAGAARWLSDVSGNALEVKLEAVRRLNAGAFSAESAEALARWAGTEAGTDAAEAFALGRRVGKVSAPEQTTERLDPTGKDSRPLFLVTLSTDAFGMPPLAPGEGEAVAYDETYPMRLRALLQQRLPHVKVEIQNFTGRGTGVQATWGRVQDLFTALNPGACVLQFGLADCWLRAGKDGKAMQTTPAMQFAQYWDGLMKKKRELAPELPMAVVGIPLTDKTTGEKFPKQNSEIRAYNKIIQEALGEDAAYVDMETFFAEHGDAIYAENGRALSATGHELLADALAEAFVPDEGGAQDELQQDDYLEFDADDMPGDMPPPVMF